MMNDEHLVLEGRKAVQRYLEESGIDVRPLKRGSRGVRQPDLEFEIRLPSGERRWVIAECKGNVRRRPVEEAVLQLRGFIEQMGPPDAVPLLFSWHLGRPTREWLRKQGVWFADVSGNRYFKAPGLLVDREVAQKTAEAKEPAPSVFADRGSLVLRHLLPRPPQEVGVRELARRLDLSAAAVSRILRKLLELGYLEKRANELRLLDRENLLEEWVSFYRSRFRGQKQDRLYVHARRAESLIDKLRSQHLAKQDGWGLSLHAGAYLVAPYVKFREVHLYVSPVAGEFRSRLISGLDARRAEAEANLVLVEPFYKASFLFEARLIRGVRVVSDLQLYLDLMCFPQRGREQAEVLLERRLRPSWSPK
jgi:hypothetical protein